MKSWRILNLFWSLSITRWSKSSQNKVKRTSKGECSRIFLRASSRLQHTLTWTQKARKLRMMSSSNRGSSKRLLRLTVLPSLKEWSHRSYHSSCLNSNSKKPRPIKKTGRHSQLETTKKIWKRSSNLLMIGSLTVQAGSKGVHTLIDFSQVLKFRNPATIFMVQQQQFWAYSPSTSSFTMIPSTTHGRDSSMANNLFCSQWQWPASFFWSSLSSSLRDMRTGVTPRRLKRSISSTKKMNKRNRSSRMMRCSREQQLRDLWLSN